MKQMARKNWSFQIYFHEKEINVLNFGKLNDEYEFMLLQDGYKASQDVGIFHHFIHKIEIPTGQTPKFRSGW